MLIVIAIDSLCNNDNCVLPEDSVSQTSIEDHIENVLQSLEDDRAYIGSFYT